MVNKVSLNVKKIWFCYIQTLSKAIRVRSDIKIFDGSANSVSLERQEYVIYFGDSNLSSKHHVKYFYQIQQITKYPRKTKALCSF